MIQENQLYNLRQELVLVDFHNLIDNYSLMISKRKINFLLLLK